MRGSRWLLFLSVLIFWPILVDSLPVLGFPCPSLAQLDLCIKVPFASLEISELGTERPPTPWTAITTVQGLETLLAQAAAEISRPKERPEELDVLLWNLGLSLDLWRFKEAPPEQGLILELGPIASLEAKLDFLTALIGLMLEKLGGPTLPKDQEMTLVLRLEDLNLVPGFILKGRSILTLDKDLNFYVDKITLTVTNGTLSSETEVEPEGFLITEERLGVKFNLGPISISSGIVIGDRRVTKEVIRMSATSGDLKMVSEASFTTEFQEFKIGATIGRLELSSTSVLTPTGLGSQTFQLELEF